MGKPKTPGQKRAYSRLNKRLSGYVMAVETIYDRLNTEAAKAALRAGYGADVGREFRFKDYPQTKATIEGIQWQFVRDMSIVIHRGTSDEWRRSNELQDLLATGAMNYYNAQIHGVRRRVYYQRNNDALKAFQQRRDRGMLLSDKLWEQSDDYRRSLEAAISTAIEKGTSAVTLSKQVSKYLQDFPSLKKDYGKRFGKATDIHDCEYRSARLARSEINMAYRRAEQLRWQQMDFIIGYEIKLSKRHPQPDMCDDLAGKYPKDFMWTGWHPNDMCYVVPILADDEDFDKMQEAILNGEPMPEIKGVVREPNEYFQDWWKDNRGRVARAQSLPYWVKDNPKYTRIKREKTQYNGAKLGRAASKSAKEAMSNHQERHNYSEEQLSNFKDIERRTGWKRGKPMSFSEADSGKSNVFRDDENCAGCVLAHELRLRGFDVTALAYNHNSGSASMLLSNDTRQAWLTSKGKTPEFTALIGGMEREIVSKLEKQTRVIGGRYHIGWDNKIGGGHIVTAERTGQGLVFYDPQRNAFLSIGEIVNDIMVGSKIELLRVDKLLVNPSLLDSIASAINI